MKIIITRKTNGCHKIWGLGMVYLFLRMAIFSMHYFFAQDKKVKGWLGVEGQGWGWVDGPEDILRSCLMYRLAYVQVAEWPN